MHYNNKVKHHVLQVWQDIWWSGRKGWKLNIRAEYHNRYSRTWYFFRWVHISVLRVPRALKWQNFFQAVPLKSSWNPKCWNLNLTTRQQKITSEQGARPGASLDTWLHKNWFKSVHFSKKQKTPKNSSSCLGTEVGLRHGGLGGYTLCKKRSKRTRKAGPTIMVCPM